MKLKLTYLYPDLCGLYGDRGNIMAIQRICSALGIELEITRVENPDDEIDFAGSDIIFISPGELSVFPPIIEALDKNREKLDEYIDSGKYIFAVGTAACIFADKVNRVSRPSYEGLGIGHFECKEREMIYGDDIIYSCTPTDVTREVAGCQVQTMDIIPKFDAEPFGKIIYGYGNNHSKNEGIRYKNVIITNALGPVVVKNPWIFADIIEDITDKKGEKADIAALDFSLEEQSFAAVKEFNLTKKTNL